jgi:hypothetical protein
MTISLVKSSTCRFNSMKEILRPRTSLKYEVVSSDIYISPLIREFRNAAHIYVPCLIPFFSEAVLFFSCTAVKDFRVICIDISKGNYWMTISLA